MVDGVPPDPRPVDRGRVAWVATGAAALAGGTLLGWDSSLLDGLAHPPALVRAGLVAAGALAGLALLAEAVRRLAEGRRVAVADLTDRDVAGLIRAVRLVFLSVAAFAAAAGWLLGNALPFIVALVIAGVDVLETSLLLLVVTIRRDA
jgi:hypothetical protein